MSLPTLSVGEWTKVIDEYIDRNTYVRARLIEFDNSKLDDPDFSYDVLMPAEWTEMNTDLNSPSVCVEDIEKFGRFYFRINDYMNAEVERIHRDVRDDPDDQDADYKCHTYSGLDVVGDLYFEQNKQYLEPKEDDDEKKEDGREKEYSPCDAHQNYHVVKQTYNVSATWNERLCGWTCLMHDMKGDDAHMKRCILIMMGCYISHLDLDEDGIESFFEVFPKYYCLQRPDFLYKRYDQGSFIRIQQPLLV